MIHCFEVANVRCGGCAGTITKVLTEAGYEEVYVDLSCEPRKVTFKALDEAQIAQVKVILRNLGYPLTSDERGLAKNAVFKAKSFVSCAMGKINS